MSQYRNPDGSVSSGVVLEVGGKPIGPGNALPVTGGAGATGDVTPGGTSGSNAQAVQGVTNGVPVPVSKADGADITLGAKADAAATGASTTGSVVSWLRGIFNALVGATPPSQAGPALGPSAALGVVQQDGQTLTLSASAAGALTGTGANATTGAIPTAGFASASVQITGIGTGNTLTYEESNDGITWYAAVGYTTSNSGSSAPGAADTSLTLRQFDLVASFFRIRCSTFGSGTMTVAVTMKVTNVAPLGINTTINGALSSTTFAGQVAGAQSGSSGGIAAVSRIPSAAATINLTQAKSSAGRVYKITGFNAASGARRIKVYNALAANVTVGTTAVFFSRVLPPGAFSYDMADIGWYCSTAISYALVQGAADNDATALAAGDVTDLNVEFA